MTNWTTNILEVSGNPADVARLMKKVKGRGGGGEEPLPFDFDRIVPMPKELIGISTGSTKIGNTVFHEWYELGDDGAPQGITPEMQKELIKKTGAKNWHDWSCQNWGTKRNACHSEKPEVSKDKRRTDVIYRFDTAWAPPEPVLRKLSAMFPKVDFHLYWEDEGDNDTHDWDIKGGKIVSQSDGIKEE